MSKPHKIERLYAWIATDVEGEDGILYVRTLDGHPIPMIGSDKERIESLRARAEEMHQVRGYPVRLVEFTRMVVLESLPTVSDQSGDRE